MKEKILEVARQSFCQEYDKLAGPFGVKAPDFQDHIYRAILAEAWKEIEENQ